MRLSRTEPAYCSKLEGMLSWAPGPQYVLRGASKCKLDGAPVYSEGPRYVYSLSTLYTVHTSHSIIQWAMSGQCRLIVLCQRVRVLVHTLYTLHTICTISTIHCTLYYMLASRDAVSGLRHLPIVALSIHCSYYIAL